MEFRDHTNDKFFESKILKLGEIHENLLAVYMFNSSTQYARTHGYSTRGRHLLNPFFNRLALTQRSLHFRAPIVFNHLPDQIKNVCTIGSFKTALKRYLLERYLQSD